MTPTRSQSRGHSIRTFTFSSIQCVITDVDRKSTRLNSSHLVISYAVFCLKKKKIKQYGAIFLGIFLLGGAMDGVLVGSVADRLGCKATLAYPILLYSLTSDITHLARSLVL